MIEFDVLDPAPAPTATAIGNPIRPRGILVVDDSEIILALLDVGLRANGFAVWTADGGRAGVATYLKHAADIDVVVLDVRMPHCDGPQALAGIRSIDPDVPCCFMSGDLGRYTEEDLMSLGATAVFQKPFHLGALTAQLRRITSPE